MIIEENAHLKTLLSLCDWCLKDGSELEAAGNATTNSLTSICFENYRWFPGRIKF
jgi:hypothetical protein